VVAVESLGKRFGERWIFRGISFELGRGDRLIVLGKNGAGKSTLLKSILGLAEPTEGSARLPERDARSSVGYSSMDMTVYPFLTPSEHLDMAGRLRGCAARSEDLLGRVGLSEAHDRLSGQLSTGMRARLKIALAVQA
jgi:ABC-type multidrug transport system ATPase subunit